MFTAGRWRSSMKAFAAFAVTVIALAPAAGAQTRVMTEHAATEATLKCLLAHGNGCDQRFVARAGLTATPWLEWDARKDFALGDLKSWAYAGTEAVNAYTTKFLHGEAADVYDVKFERRELTFYIVPPGPDGRVHYIFIRRGGPDDEIADFWARNPLGLF